MKNSLQTRLIVLIVVFAFLSAALVGTVNMYLGTKAAKEKVLESNRTIATQLSAEMERFMGDAKGLIEAVALAPSTYGMDPVQVRQAILAIQQKNPQFELIFVMDTTGMQIARTSGNLANRADRTYFKEAMKGSTFFTDTYISSFTQGPTITISTPIKNASGVTVGVFAADVSLKAIWEMAEKTAIGQGGYIDVVDQKGNFIAHPNKERVLKIESAAKMPYVAEVISGKSGAMDGQSTTGIDAAVAYAPMKMLQWGVLTYLPATEITAMVTKNLLVMVGLILVAVVLAGVTAIYVARSIARPLTELAGAADEMARGNLAQVVNARGVAEVDALAAALETMRQGLRDIVTNIMASSEQVAASSEELTASAEQSAQATNQVAQAIGEVAAGVDRQTKALEKTASVTEQMSSGVAEIARNASQVENMTDKTNQSAAAGKNAVDAAVSQMGKIEATVEQSASIVTKLGDSSKRIGEIIGTISGIASQTNLLALNAAIEAARAGEQGRGFAVVAEEVRKLAEGSEVAARQIAEIISEIQSDTESAVIAMNKGTAEVSAGAEVVHSAGVTFAEISRQLSEVSSQVKVITAAIHAMAKGSQDIVGSVREIDLVSKKTAEETETVSAATEEQAASMEEIASASQVLARLAEELQVRIGRFKI